MTPEDIIAREFGKLFMQNVALTCALEKLKAELEDKAQPEEASDKKEI